MICSWCSMHALLRTSKTIKPVLSEFVKKSGRFSNVGDDKALCLTLSLRDPAQGSWQSHEVLTAPTEPQDDMFYSCLPEEHERRRMRREDLPQ